MDKPMTFIEWCAGKGVIPYSLGIEAAYEAGQQSMQAKVEELQTQLSLQRQRVKAFEEELTSSRNYGDELQKRVDAALKLIESWNEIAFDKTTHWTEGYEEGCYHCAAQLEQALKGEG
ncbi:hypothetical protein [Acinetobacter baumannii]|uniref:hypothetical protein n=1 Tax=Acinetobacter baumannii TaxID=470 RepID=UPI0022B2F5E4|nr:hypothetical protein [Acinetobacter baumannii]MCZ6920621.1 hypothetical protein [Acinetobacter baumannii]